MWKSRRVLRLRGDDLHLEGDPLGRHNPMRLRLDVGLSHNAPNSAYWLKHEDQKLLVVGFEPNKGSFERVRRRIWSTNVRPRIRRFRSDRFLPINCAISDVSERTVSRLHEMAGDPGTSSLLVPTDVLTKKFGYTLHRVAEVQTVSIDWFLTRFTELCEFECELLKVDTQGHDLQVLKSAGGWLSKFAVLQVETVVFGQYENAPAESEIVSWLSSKGFVMARRTVVEGYGTDAIFLNSNDILRARKVLDSLPQD